MASLVVTYPRSEGATFDAEYYANVHIPLARKHWEPCGMTAADVLFPADAAQPYAAMVVMRFADAAAIDKAMAAPGTPEVMGDVPKFTSIRPNVFRSAD